MVVDANCEAGDPPVSAARQRLDEVQRRHVGRFGEVDHETLADRRTKSIDPPGGVHVVVDGERGAVPGGERDDVAIVGCLNLADGAVEFGHRHVEVVRSGPAARPGEARIGGVVFQRLFTGLFGVAGVVTHASPAAPLTTQRVADHQFGSRADGLAERVVVDRVAIEHQRVAIERPLSGQVDDAFPCSVEHKTADGGHSGMNVASVVDVDGKDRWHIVGTTEIAELGFVVPSQADVRGQIDVGSKVVSIG